MSVDLTTTVVNSKVFVSFTATMVHNREDRLTEVGLFVDGVERFRGRIAYDKQATENMLVTLTYLVQNLAAIRSYNFRMRWRPLTNDFTVTVPVFPNPPGPNIPNRVLTVIEQPN